MNDSLVRLALVPANITRLHADDDAMAATRDADDDDDDGGGSVAFQIHTHRARRSGCALRAPCTAQAAAVCVCLFSQAAGSDALSSLAVFQPEYPKPPPKRPKAQAQGFD